MRRTVALAAAMFAAMGLWGAAAGTPILSWKGAELKSWASRNQCEIASSDEGLTVVSTGTDPFVQSPPVEIDRPLLDHVVIVRAKATKGGRGEFFYWRQGDQRALSSLKQAFMWVGGESEREYRIRPFWNGQPKIVRLRLDFPAIPGERYLVTEVSVVNDPVANLPLVGKADPNGGVAFTVPPFDRTSWATVEWWGDESNGRAVVPRHFHLIGDGKPRRYYFDGSACASFGGNFFSTRQRGNWRGAIREFSVRNDRTQEAIPIGELEFTGRRADIRGELVASATDMPLAFNRVGQPFAVEIGLFNPGTMAVRGAKADISGLPEGVRLIDPERARRVVPLDGWQSVLHAIDLQADRPCSFVLSVRFSGGGIPESRIEVPVRVGPSLGLPKATDYIPEPRPLAKGKYEIGAFYFTDWVRADQWMKIWRTDPRRKPALGWYDNRSSEAVDWQIKWAVENGISFYLVDWYNATSSDHFNTALAKARFRKYIKWALMWCNHVPEGKCSEEIWVSNVRCWIEKYFGTAEYYRVNGLPCVSVWDPDNLDRDNGGPGGCRRMLDLARKMAKDAGYGGIWFQGMANDDESPARGRALQEKRKAQGLDETTMYHYLGIGRRPADGRCRAFADVASSSGAYWREVSRVPGIAYLPNLSTGWDDHPWNDDCQVRGRSVAAFRSICEAARRFGDETGIRRFCLAPLNEWGEGSYAEPNGEFGFGMFEAVRETFFERPAEGWPLNFTPADVGRGPYSVPQVGEVVQPWGGQQWR